jgi:hypothetical protein
MNDELIKRDVEIASRLAFGGAALSTISMALGLSVKELKERSEKYPELGEAIDGARAKGIGIVLANLLKLASETDDVNAIKYYLGIQNKDYRIEKATVEVNTDNRQITLPTLEQARLIIMNDPAMIPSTDNDDPTK